jgi:hypothetical protein
MKIRNVVAGSAVALAAGLGLGALGLRRNTVAAEHGRKVTS